MNDTPGLVALLLGTGRAHHEAFLATDGVDAEWPRWYAEHLIAPMQARGYRGTRAELVGALVEADRRFQQSGGDVPWPQFYAEHLLHF